MLNRADLVGYHGVSLHSLVVNVILQSFVVHHLDRVTLLSGPVVDVLDGVLLAWGGVVYDVLGVCYVGDLRILSSILPEYVLQIAPTVSSESNLGLRTGLLLLWNSWA